MSGADGQPGLQAPESVSGSGFVNFGHELLEVERLELFLREWRKSFLNDRLLS